MRHKLLLADDSVTIQRVIELTFADEDIDVIAVGDGQMAIDHLDADPPDIVLADIDMPKRDGYEVAAYVRSRPSLAHIPVVLLTGAFEPINQARALEAGSSDVLAKPFEPQMLINRVKQLLSHKRDDEREAPVRQGLTPPPPAQPTKLAEAPRPPARSSMPMNDEHATGPSHPAPQAPGGPEGPAGAVGEDAQQAVSLDDYFDQLDAAFSNLQTGAPAQPHDLIPSQEEWIEILPQTASHPVEQPAPIRSAPPPVAPVRQADAQPAPAAPRAFEPLITPPPSPPPVTNGWEPLVEAAPPPAPAPLPRPDPPAAAAIPASEPPPRPIANPFAELSAAKAEVVARSAPAITDEVIEAVVARVLERLSDRVVRETVGEIVSRTAERLVQEEILRIKTQGQ